MKVGLKLRQGGAKTACRWGWGADFCNLPSRAIAVYLYLRGRANKEGVCWPAIPTMARELKMSESTVRRGVRDLEKAGFLSVEERFRWNKADSSNLYVLVGQSSEKKQLLSK